MDSIFQFKQFSVLQDNCAMKVGTDGVLLGAWTPITGTEKSILDVGTGCGLLALMLAQRTTSAYVDAIEIEDQAYEQAVENFENSDWNDRLFCYHGAFQEFSETPEDSYELILCNPPFHSGNPSTKNPQRSIARSESVSLSLLDLVIGSTALLSDHGRLSVIIPYSKETRFLELCATNKLFPKSITRVKGTASAPIKRSLILLEKIKPTKALNETLAIDQLIIEKSRHRYTDAYREITQDFYLNF